MDSPSAGFNSVIYDYVNYLQNLYQSCVEPMTSPDAAADWVRQCIRRLLLDPPQVNLVYCTLSENSYNFDMLKRFLSPYGSLWQTMFWLETEHNYRFEPNSGSRPSTNVNDSRLLSPVEYFLFHFAQHLNLGALDKYISNSYSMDVPTDNVYLTLLQDYVSFFLPTQGPFPVANMTAALSSDGLFEQNEQDQQKMQNRQFRTPLGLFKRNLFRNGSQNFDFDKSNKGPLHSSDVLWKSWTFVRTLLELWLTLDSRSVSLMQITAIRYMLKHIHCFVFSPTTAGNTALSDFKQIIFPRLVQPLLFPFLRYQFEHWPLDASFRHVLETWLTFLQPWRYVGTGNLDSNSRWEGFINENHQYYVVLLNLAVRRMLRMDLDSNKTIFLASRVVKVFCNQPILLQAVQDVNEVERRTPTPSTTWQNDTTSMERENLRELMAELLMKIEKTKIICERRLELENTSMEKDKNANNQSWFSSLFFEDDLGAIKQKEERKVIEQLEIISQNLCQSFDLPQPQLNSDELQYSKNIGVARGSIPDHYRDSITGLLKLSPTGRYQVQNNLSKFKFDNSAAAVIPPDLAPIRSSEIAPLVRLLHRLNMWFNQKYFVRSFSNSYFEAQTFRGRLARRVLEAPTLPCPTASPFICNSVPSLPPRLNLRPLATYRCAFCFGIIVLLGNIMFDLNPIATLLIFIAFYICYNSVRALSPC